MLDTCESFLDYTLIQFGGLVAETFTSDPEHEVSPETIMHQVLIKRNLRGTFLNVEVLLRIYDFE